MSLQWSLVEGNKPSGGDEGNKVEGKGIHHGEASWW